MEYKQVFFIRKAQKIGYFSEIIKNNHKFMAVLFFFLIFSKFF